MQRRTRILSHLRTHKQTRKYLIQKTEDTKVKKGVLSVHWEALISTQHTKHLSNARM